MKSNLTNNLNESQPVFGSLVGNSQAMQEVFALTRKVAKADVTVLLTGESGTGKELLARAIHNLSLRRDKPLLAVNCAALLNSLLESELFGHEKGAFTGAVSKRKGKFELAHQGTLFLDEIGDMSLEAQAKILRIIEEGKFEPIGSEKTIQVDNRIVAATNRNLVKETEEGRFRRDLYYRLNEFAISLPPLRERREDVPLLISHFVKEFNKELSKQVEGVSDVALNYLEKHSWPGNVRELRSVIKRAMILIDGDVIWLEHLPFEINLMSEETLEEEGEFLPLKENEKRYIARILARTKWNKSQAANILEISRHRLDRKINLYNLKPTQ